MLFTRFSGVAVLATVCVLPGISLADTSTCNLAQLAWAESKYFLMGDITHQDGQWYRAREPHSRIDPASGQFAWEPIPAPPGCEEAVTEEAPSVTSSHSPYGAPALPEPVSRTVTIPAQPTITTTTHPDPHNAAPTSSDITHSSSANLRFDVPAPPAQTLVTETPSVSPPATDPPCGAVEPWSYANSYLAGDRVEKDGVVFEAIYPTNASIPGNIGSPHWVQVTCNL